MSYENLKLDKQLCHRLYIATNGITRHYRSFLEALNLTYPQYILMLALWEVEKAPVQTLQSLTKIDSGSLTLILKKVQEKKFIEIKTDKEDKRKKIVSLTAKGLSLKTKAKDVPENMFSKIDKLSPLEVEELVRILDKINDQIG